MRAFSKADYAFKRDNNFRIKEARKNSSIWLRFRLKQRSVRCFPEIANMKDILCENKHISM